MYLLIELFTLPYAMPPTGYALAPLTGAMKCSRTPCLPTLPLTFRLSSRYWSNSVLGGSEKTQYTCSDWPGYLHSLKMTEGTSGQWQRGKCYARQQAKLWPLTIRSLGKNPVEDSNMV